MNSINLISLVGVVANELICFKEAGGRRVSLRIETTGNDKNRKNTFDVEAFDDLADFAYDNLVKGSRVLVEGEPEGESARIRAVGLERLDD